ncbi:Protein of unknown function [Pyronema omphalodes CBS 100304]|uniref:Uncharacterized protein n=1 Tax=Pyronema omphalodes (strain CBS 100304) TaxID=1076935 RepID=U4LFT5_PYROM|nr:Protein of unknown function [Pyronema omphalodes CBS 100304]
MSTPETPENMLQISPDKNLHLSLTTYHVFTTSSIKSGIPLTLLHHPVDSPETDPSDYLEEIRRSSESQANLIAYLPWQGEPKVPEATEKHATAAAPSTNQNPTQHTKQATQDDQKQSKQDTQSKSFPIYTFQAGTEIPFNGASSLVAASHLFTCYPSLDTIVLKSRVGDVVCSIPRAPRALHITYSPPESKPDHQDPITIQLPHPISSSLQTSIGIPTNDTHPIHAPTLSGDNSQVRLKFSGPPGDREVSFIELSDEEELMKTTPTPATGMEEGVMFWTRVPNCAQEEGGAEVRQVPKIKARCFVKGEEVRGMQPREWRFGGLVKEEQGG